ncbi:hypothetical protein APR04_003696 [Promicromonospora umidemergens]|uniref:DUF8094 domain-containing protein n=1 Tax=Promicromonospora umidemergens TaxID=629679 RepID=A0ABP8YAS9_9MICO|nr:hypothetical protein [Promicromonospora umidemergens]MCP2284773.1 hypothetical protein [Promicromonospora umidemergens]
MLRPDVSSAARRRGAGCLAAVGVVSVLLAGCTVEPPTPAPDAPAIAAVVSEPQERKILDAVATSIAKHDNVSAADGLRARMTGPALSMREAELRLAEDTGEERWRTDLSMQTQQTVLPSDQSWPRTSYAVQAQPADTHTPALMVFDQASAREQYKLWGYVNLVPGASLPPFAQPELGSAAVAPDDDTSLVRSPQDALAEYAEVLSEDSDAKGTGAFADDRLRQDLRAIEKSQTGVADWAETKGKYSFTAEVEPSLGLRAVRTADGGALVLGGLTGTQTIEVGQKGAKINTDALPSAQQVLFGDEAETNRLRTRYHDFVALYVPSAGSAHKITLVGFRHIPIDVSGE